MFDAPSLPNAMQFFISKPKEDIVSFAHQKLLVLLYL